MKPTHLAGLLLCGALSLGACGSSGAEIARVTALPEGITAATRTPQAAAQNAVRPTLRPFITTTPAPATPIPRDIDLAPGEARQIAYATDIAFSPEIETRITFDQDPVPLSFTEFYGSFNMRTGWVLSDKLLSLDGQRVVMEGYMAPPLKPALDWFVLTGVQLSLCPFCSADTDWPSDMALLYMNGDEILATGYPIRVTGELQVGSSVDAESGMVSLVRIYADSVEVLD